MSAARLLLASVVLVRGVVACGGECRSPVESGPGATGSITYVQGDGRSATTALTSGDVDVTNDKLALTGDFKDADGHPRGYVLTLTGLSTNASFDLRGHGQLCFSRAQNAPPSCADLTGSVTLSTLSADCSRPTQGIYTCAESVSGTITAQSDWEGTTWKLDATMSKSGRWVSETCEED